MYVKYVIPALLLVSATAVAADSPLIPQPLAPSPQATSGAVAFKPAPKLRLPSPKFNETTLVRQPDGSLRMQCNEVPNPRAKITLPNHSVTPAVKVQQ